MHAHRLDCGKLLSRVAGVWWKTFPSYRRLQLRSLMIDSGRAETLLLPASSLRQLQNSLSSRALLQSKLFPRLMATQRSKLEYFHDLHGDMSSDSRKEAEVSTIDKIKTPIQITEESSEGSVVRQRGPRQKYRTASSNSDSGQRSVKDSPEAGRTVLSITAQRPQRCVAYCTAESYNFERLLQSLQKNRIPSLYFSEVIHVSIPRAPPTHEEFDGQEGDVFYFKDGCVVFWDIAHPHALQLLSELAPFEEGAYDRHMVFDMYSEEIGFHYGKHAGILPTGELVLSVGQNNWAKTQVCIFAGIRANESCREGRRGDPRVKNDFTRIFVYIHYIS
jgi:hypothetical protein